MKKLMFILYILILPQMYGVAQSQQALRPQDPTSFPYLQEEVKFVNKKGGHTLSGSLTIPSDSIFSKIVILISGSGPQNRNEEMAMFNHRPFLVLSDHLTRQGIAVLRFDDRGVGESEGSQEGSTSYDFAQDVIAAIQYLNSRKDMNGKMIGLAGHSEGGMIAPIVASQSDAVDFIILLAGPGIPINELMVLQAEHGGRAAGAPEEILAANSKLITQAYEYIIVNKDMRKDDLKTGLKKVFKDNINLFPEAVRASIDNDVFYEQQVGAMVSDWFLYFMRYDVAGYLSRVTCPVLAINGALDTQVTPDENLKGIGQILYDAGNKNVTIMKMANQNHIFQVAKTGSVLEYGQIEETFNEDTMRFISIWINNFSR